MRLPTLAGLTAAVRGVAARFPEALLAGVASAVLASIAVRGHGGAPTASWAAAGLGISLFFVAAVTSEALRPERVGRFDALRVALDAFALMALVALGLAWPHWSDAARAHRLIQFALATHLFASFAPFLRRYDANAFWQWNRALFARFLSGALFSAVLFGGLAVALAAAKPLFGLRVHERAFVDLWFAIVFVFQTAYVLAGVPRDHAVLAEDRQYPIGLKVFAQFLLVPLVALYLVILTAYLVKVLVTGQWPNGWVGWLVSSVSAAGLLAILLVHPVRDRDENRWIATFSRWFFVALLPSVGMLFAAIGKRVGQYGVTEERYDLFALAAWVAVVSVGYTLRRRADIRWIPISLCVVAVLTSFGPWGAYSVSRADQARRLVRAIERLGLGDPERRPAANALPFEERRRVSDAVRYLVGTHGLRALPAALRAAADADPTFRAYDERTKQNGDLAAQAVMRGLGQGYVSRWETEANHSFFFQAAERPGRIDDLRGFDRALRLDGFGSWYPSPRGAAAGAWFDSHTRVLAVADSAGGRWSFALDSLIEARLAAGGSPQPASGTPRVILETSDRGVRARLVLRTLQGSVQGDSAVIHQLGGEVYLGQR